MGLLLQQGRPHGRYEPIGLLGRSPDECRRRAEQCRDLVDSCLTEEAAQILNALAVDLDLLAVELESRRPTLVGSGRN